MKRRNPNKKRQRERERERESEKEESKRQTCLFVRGKAGFPLHMKNKEG